MALIGLVGTAYLAALALNFIMDIEVLSALLYTIPLSILSSAIILPSIDDLDEDKREFMIYESTFSDIIGIIGFYTVLTVVDSQPGESVTGEVIGGLALTVVLSIIISYILIYVFQNIKGHVKLFLLIAILLLLYAIGKMFHLSSLIIILVFGMILNNYKVFFRGFLRKLLNKEKVDGVLGDMKVITAESAFVVRTFFFIIFGWFADIGSLLSFKVVGVGLVVLAIIYTVRVIVLFLFNGKDIITRLFLAPRGLITILLFFTIPDEMFEYKIHEDLRGVLLFIILISCFIMTWSMINYKKKITQIVEGEDDKISNTNKDDGEILNTNKEISEDDSIDILKNSIDN